MLRHTLKFAAVALLGLTLSVSTLVENTIAGNPVMLPPGGVQLKIPVGFERWTPGPIPNPETLVTLGTGWFRQNNLTLDDINTGYPALGFRAFDIEVEQWGEDPRFSAVFVQNTGIFEAGHWFVAVGTESDIRYHLNEGQWQNYRMMDLEVHQYHPTPLGGGKDTPEEVTQFDPMIAVLLVTNEGNQYTEEWDFIVYATPIDLLAFESSFIGEVRMIDNEISLDDTINHANEGESLQHVVFSQIMVSDEGSEHLETAVFQFDSILSLWALERQDWQLIDSERNIPLMPNQFPEQFSTFTGVFVQKPNNVEFLPNEDSYSNLPIWSTDNKRMIDLELEPFDNKAGFRLDELFLQH